MPEADAEQTFGFLGRTYRVIRLVAVTIGSIIGVLVTVSALKIQISQEWTAVRLPMYWIAIIVLILCLCLGLPLVFAVVMLRDSLRTSSYYRSQALNLNASVKGLEELAYVDPITGIPNNNALSLEINRTAGQPNRCLILIDLFNFREINKKYNHWAGDEYMRRFSSMVSQQTRRNEILYKDRESRSSDGPERTGKRRLFQSKIPSGRFASDSDSTASPKTFRRNNQSDEFFILLKGPILDGLGYLNRLLKSAPDFEAMSKEILGEVHPFYFQAGVTMVGLTEPFESAGERVAECLLLAREATTPRSIYWTGELPKFGARSWQAKLVEDVLDRFDKSKMPRRN